MNYGYIALAILAVIVIILLVWLIKARNSFVVLRNRVNDQRAQIDVQLKRRYDLIPNLVETAKAYSGFERSTLEAVVSARARAVAAEGTSSELAENDRLTAALHRFMAVGESYPELKSSGHFLQLQQELATTENKIASSRQFFNDTVMKYNNAVQMFPANIAAGIFGFKPYEYLETAQAERESIRFDANTFK